MKRKQQQYFRPAKENSFLTEGRKGKLPYRVGSMSELQFYQELPRRYLTFNGKSIFDLVIDLFKKFSIDYPEGEPSQFLSNKTKKLLEANPVNEFLEPFNDLTVKTTNPTSLKKLESQFTKDLTFTEIYKEPLAKLYEKLENELKNYNVDKNNPFINLSAYIFNEVILEGISNKEDILGKFLSFHSQKTSSLIFDFLQGIPHQEDVSKSLLQQSTIFEELRPNDRRVRKLDYNVNQEGQITAKVSSEAPFFKFERRNENLLIEKTILIAAPVGQFYIDMSVESDEEGNHKLKIVDAYGESHFWSGLFTEGGIKRFGTLYSAQLFIDYIEESLAQDAEAFLQGSFKDTETNLKNYYQALNRVIKINNPEHYSAVMAIKEAAITADINDLPRLTLALNYLLQESSAQLPIFKKETKKKGKKKNKKKRKNKKKIKESELKEAEKPQAITSALLKSALYKKGKNFEIISNIIFPKKLKIKQKKIKKLTTPPKKPTRNKIKPKKINFVLVQNFNNALLAAQILLHHPNKMKGNYAKKPEIFITLKIFIQEIQRAEIACNYDKKTLRALTKALKNVIFQLAKNPKKLNAKKPKKYKELSPGLNSGCPAAAEQLLFAAINNNLETAPTKAVELLSDLGAQTYTKAKASFKMSCFKNKAYIKSLKKQAKTAKGDYTEIHTEATEETYKNLKNKLENITTTQPLITKALIAIHGDFSKNENQTVQRQLILLQALDLVQQIIDQQTQENQLKNYCKLVLKLIKLNCIDTAVALEELLLNTHKEAYEEARNENKVPKSSETEKLQYDQFYQKMLDNALNRLGNTITLTENELDERDTTDKSKLSSVRKLLIPHAIKVRNKLHETNEELKLEKNKSTRRKNIKALVTATNCATNTLKNPGDSQNVAKLNLAKQTIEHGKANRKRIIKGALLCVGAFVLFGLGAAAIATGFGVIPGIILKVVAVKLTIMGVGALVSSGGVAMAKEGVSEIKEGRERGGRKQFGIFAKKTTKLRTTRAKIKEQRPSNN